MDKQCNFCGNKKYIKKEVDYMFKREGEFMVVENVPCEECGFCGERYYKADVLKQIETRQGKPFSTVSWIRRIRDKHYEETKDMSDKERIQYIRERVKKYNKQLQLRKNKNGG